MPIRIQIKRRLEGDPGPPCDLQAGELAFNEVEGILYIGTSQVVDLSGTDVIGITACSGMP